MADINELLAALPDGETKAALEAEVKRVVKERGEFGQKLYEKDKALQTEKEKGLEYGKAKESLEKAGIKPEEIPALLEKLGVQKTVQDELALTSSILKEKVKTLTETEKELKRFKAERAISTIFEKERAAFQNEEGKTVTISEYFINKDKLLDTITDFSDETVLTEKVKSALKASYTEQEKVKATLGFPGAKVPNTPEKKEVPDKQVSEIETIFKEQGPLAAIAAQLALDKK